jgi:tRNA A-37 threonylcarbamoyl transferase component Bud32
LPEHYGCVTEPTIVLPDALGSVTDTKSAREVARFSKRFREEWLFRATLRNSLRACVAARRSSWLRVPNILHADAEELRIDYEFLDGWQPLHSLIRHRTFRGLPAAELRRTFWTIGAALQEFHRYTHRIHGDFDIDNILVKRGARRVVFVDFTPPEYACSRGYNQANPYRDLALFVLFVRAKYPPQRLYLALRPQLRGLARAFLNGYFQSARAKYDRRSLDSAMNELTENTYLSATFCVRYLRRSRLFRTDDLAPEA